MTAEKKPAEVTCALWAVGPRRRSTAASGGEAISGGTAEILHSIHRYLCTLAAGVAAAATPPPRRRGGRSAPLGALLFAEEGAVHPLGQFSVGNGGACD